MALFLAAIRYVEARNTRTNPACIKHARKAQEPVLSPFGDGGLRALVSPGSAWIS